MKPPIAYIVIGASLAIALIAGHVINQERATFPFVKWDMFGATYTPSEAVFYEYQGVRADGSMKKLNLTHLYPSLANQMPIGMEQLSEQYVTTEPAAHADLVRIFGRRHNLLYPNDPLIGIAVVRGSVVCSADGIPAVSRKTVQKVRIDNASAQ